MYKSLPTRWRRKPAGIDIERNYVTVTLCIYEPRSLLLWLLVVVLVFIDVCLFQVGYRPIVYTPLAHRRASKTYFPDQQCLTLTIKVKFGVDLVLRAKFSVV